MKRRIVVGVPLVLLGLPGVIGVLHLAVARPLLALIGVGCPVRASPEEVEAARLTSARAARGTATSPERPALGFALDRMTPADIDAWVTRHAIDCTESQRGAVLTCKNVTPVALGQASGAPIDDLSFAFDPKASRLVTVTTLRSHLDASAAAAKLQAIAAGLAAKLGPGRSMGQPTADYLAQVELRTALVEYRYFDYIASVSATNLGGRVAVREHYMSAVD